MKGALLFLVISVTKLKSAYCRNWSFVLKQVDNGTFVEAEKSGRIFFMIFCEVTFIFRSYL